MSTVRVYKSTDPGAPPHPSALRGSMAALLRACLVVGYGSGGDAKAPAGWEEPFAESGNYAVFRALTGARQFFQIDDNQADADVAAMYAFESMSDVITGSGQWVFASDSYRFFGKWQSDSYASWVVIADELTCYVFLSGMYGLIPHGFGEYKSYRDDNPYRSFRAGHSVASSMQSSSNAYQMSQVGSCTITNSGPYMHKGMTYAGRGQAPCGSPYGINTYSPGGAQFVADDDYGGLSYPVLPYEIGSGDGTSAVGGRLRGLYFPCANRPKTHLEQFTHDGKTMLAINYGYATATGFYGQFWLDITGSWA